MGTINIDKYKFIVNWIEDDREFNYINKKVDSKTKEIVEQNPFTPLRLVIKLFPKKPYETIYEMDSTHTMPNISNSSGKMSVPVEKKTVYQPYKIDIGSKDMENCILKTKRKSVKYKENGNRTIDITKYEMDYQKMIDDAQVS